MLESSQLATLQDEVVDCLHRDIASAWFPRCIDHGGGFHQDFSREWSLQPSEDRFVVFQSRMTWIAAKLADAVPVRRHEFVDHAAHGARYLREHFWDDEHGGHRWEVPGNGEKMTYGLAFALFGLAAAAGATGDPVFLDQAREAWRWIDEHVRDSENGGYFEAASPDGTPLLEPTEERHERQIGGIGSRFGLKVQNTHLHVLEALTELYSVWPDPLLRDRLEEAVDIIGRKMYSWPGALHVSLTRDWKPLPRACSFGHDVEAAYLLIEASRALGRPNDKETWATARALVDHALTYGFDNEQGGFFEQGEAAGRPWDRTRGWWTQVEGLNALAALVCLSDRGLDQRYVPPLLRQWEWVRDRQIDREHRGLYARVAEDGTVLGEQSKGHRWKAAYHDGRAFINVSRWLANVIP